MTLVELFPGRCTPPGPTAEEIERDLAAERAAGIAKAQEFYRDGRRGRALYELARSLERQIRIAGLGSHEVRTPSLATATAWERTR